MYLLNAETRKLEAFIGSKIPAYAILSHTWGDEEVSFKDLTEHSPMPGQPSAEEKKGYSKIRKTCGQALKDGISYAWVDTCTCPLRFLTVRPMQNTAADRRRLHR